MRVNSVMILVFLSTHAELASATAQGRLYWETGQLPGIFLQKQMLSNTMTKKAIPNHEETDYG